MMTKMKHIFLLAIAVGALNACAPTKETRGNLLDNYQMQQIVAGQDLKDDVIAKIGSPTTVSTFNPNIWYYMGQRTEKRGILDPELKKERIVVVTFGDDGRVNSVVERREGRQDVMIVQRETPTSGNDFTFTQQLLGNLGKFNQPSGNAAETAGGGVNR
jgi:outer membrane protein assembly factor BamE (lipoprotein component of BamABCDE complex)